MVLDEYSEAHKAMLSYSEKLKDLGYDNNHIAKELRTVAQEIVATLHGVSEKKLEVKIEPYECYPCNGIFEINGESVDEDWFVVGYDHCPSKAPEYGCGDWKAYRYPIHEVRKKLIGTKFENLSDEEIYMIQIKLEDAFDVGTCAWCA